MREGDFIVTRPATTQHDLGMDIGGWKGRVIDVGTGMRGQEMVCIGWDGPTLEQMPDALIEMWKEDGVDWRVTWLDASEVELERSLTLRTGSARAQQATGEAGMPDQASRPTAT